MSEINTGGSAFPVPEDNYPSNGTYSNPGMNLRDWFASNATDRDIDSIEVEFFDPDKNEWVYRSRAVRRYVFADAMIAVREGRP